MPVNFQYESENARKQALIDSDGFRAVLDFFHKVYADATCFAQLQSRNFPVTERTEPGLYDLYLTAAERLQVSADVPVYLTFDHQLKAETVGTDDNCAIVVSSECVERCSDEQMIALFGHELSHILYRHVCFLNVEKLLDSLIARIPMVGGLAAETIRTLMLEWKLTAEYTADRGAAIAAGRMQPVLKNMMCSMGGFQERDRKLLEVPDTEDVFSDVSDISRFSKAGQAVVQILAKEFEQPFGNLRICELRSWCGQENCRDQFSPVYYQSAVQRLCASETEGDILYLQAKEKFAYDREGALILYHAAAGKGSSGAQAFLGRSYLRGKNGLSESAVWGLEYLKNAALQNDPNGWFGLGICYQNGVKHVLRPDPRMSQWLLQLAAEKGLDVARRYLQPEMPQTPLFSAKVLPALREYQEMIPQEENGELVFYTERENGEGQLSHLRAYLWIPEADSVYVSETLVMGAGRETVIALTEYGIYRNLGASIPARVSWREFALGELTGEDVGTDVELRLDGRFLVNLYRDGSAYSIPRMLVKLKRQLR